MPRGIKSISVKNSEATRKTSKIKDIDDKIKSLEKELEDLKKEKKALIIAENSEKLMEINDLISESGLSMAQIKALIKEKKAEPKKPRGKKKKEEEIPVSEETK